MVGVYGSGVLGVIALYTGGRARGGIFHNTWEYGVFVLFCLGGLFGLVGLGCLEFRFLGCEYFLYEGGWVEDWVEGVEGGQERGETEQGKPEVGRVGWVFCD